MKTNGRGRTIPDKTPVGLEPRSSPPTDMHHSYSAACVSLSFLYSTLSVLGGAVYVYVYQTKALTIIKARQTIITPHVQLGREVGLFMVCMGLVSYLGSANLARLLVATSWWRRGWRKRAGNWSRSLYKAFNPSIHHFSIGFAATATFAGTIASAVAAANAPATGVTVIGHDVIAGLFSAGAVLVIADLWAARKVIGPALGSYARGVLALLTIVAFVSLRHWLGVSWGSIAVAAGVTAGGIGVWRWAFPLDNSLSDDESSH